MRPAAALGFGVALVIAIAIRTPAPSLAQDRAPDRRGREFAERISVMAIEIPVRVLVDGRPVAGLSRDNFRVREGGRVHEITGFERVDLTERPSVSTVGVGRSAVAPAPGEGRRLLFLFDIAYSGRRPLLRAVDGARGLVGAGLHRADRAAVATYSAVHGLHFLTGFTTDREATGLALDVVAAGVGGERKAHEVAARALAERGGLVTAATPLERFRTLTELFGRTAAVAFEESEADFGIVALGGVGSVFEPAPRGRFSAGSAGGDPVRQSFQNFAPSDIAAGLSRGVGRSGVRALSLELIEMATVLRDLPGQKHLFFLSQGFGSGLLEDATALDHLENALEALRRANWAIQAIDIQGGGFDAHALFYLANETGGELIENHADFEKAATKLVQRTAVSYVLTIQPTDVPADGGYRRLEVNLVDGPRRARVIHRPGYYTPKPRSERNSLENTLDAAALVLSGRELSDLAVEVLALPLPLPGRGLAEVPVVVEVPVAELGPAVRGGVRLEFHGYALDGAGQIRDLFSQRLRVERQEIRELIDEGGGIRFYDRVSLPPGDYSLRLLTRNLTTGAAFLGTFPIAVDFVDGEPGVYGPLFVHDDGWAVVRGEGSLNGGRGIEHPFVLAGKPRVPSPRPAIASGADSVFFLRTAWVDGDDLRVRARVLDSGGRPVEGAVLAFRERVLGDGDEVEALIGTLAAGDLEPGPYRLEVTARWDRGNRKSVGLGDFWVVDR